MSVPLDESYFTWLYSQVATVGIEPPSQTYFGLLKKLFITKFVWFIANDDNRREDGRALRLDFLDEEKDIKVTDEWLDLNCSMLELLIGLSRRLSFIAEGEPDFWFWKLIENLGLEDCTDNIPLDKEYVKEVLNQVIFRTYGRNGRGGLFPLKKTTMDQRERELWYQLNDYVLENS